MPRRRSPNVSAILQAALDKYNITTDEIPCEEEPLDIERFIQDVYDKTKIKSCRYFLSKSPGGFRCGRKHEGPCQPSCSHPCDHGWSSGQTWCIVDLKKLRILKPIRQECKRHNHRTCNDDDDDDDDDDDSDYDVEEYTAIPLYGKETVKKIAEWAVKRYLINTGRLADQTEPARGFKKTPAHCQALCDMCKKLKRRCC